MEVLTDIAGNVVTDLAGCPKVSGNELLTNPEIFQAGMSNLDTSPTFVTQDSALFANHIHPIARGEYIYFFSDNSLNSAVIKKVLASNVAAVTDVSFIAMGTTQHYCFSLTADNKIIVITNAGLVYLINEDDSYTLYDNISYALNSFTPRCIAFSDSNTLYFATYQGASSSTLFRYNLGSKTVTFVATLSGNNNQGVWKLVCASNRIFAFSERTRVFSVNLSTNAVTNLEAANVLNSGPSINGIGALVRNKVYASTLRSADITIVNTSNNAIINTSPAANSVTASPTSVGTGAFVLPNGQIVMYGRFENYSSLGTPVTIMLDPSADTITYPTTINLSFLTTIIKMSVIDFLGHCWIGSVRLQFTKSKTQGVFKTIFKY